VPGFQAGEEVAVGYGIWELVKDAIFWGAFVFANRQPKVESRRLITVTCKCQIEAGPAAIGYAQGIGVGATFADARAAAYHDAYRDARRQLGANTGFYLRHCQFWTN